MKTFFLDSSSSLRDLGHFSQYRQSIFHLPQQQCLVLTILRRFWGQTSNFKRFPTDSVGKEQRNMTNSFEQYAKFWLSHVGGAIYFQKLCAALLSTRGKERFFPEKITSICLYFCRCCCHSMPSCWWYYCHWQCKHLSVKLVCINVELCTKQSGKQMQTNLSQTK